MLGVRRRQTIRAGVGASGLPVASGRGDGHGIGGGSPQGSLRLQVACLRDRGGVSARGAPWTGRTRRGAPWGEAKCTCLFSCLTGSSQMPYLSL